jgi:hypothetical protein
MKPVMIVCLPVCPVINGTGIRQPAFASLFMYAQDANEIGGGNDAGDARSSQQGK